MIRRALFRSNETRRSDGLGSTRAVPCRSTARPSSVWTPAPRLALLAAAALPLVAACRTRPADAAPDAGAGAPALGVQCSAEVGPPLAAQLEAPASRAQAQSAQWTVLSNDPECATLRPAGVPQMLSWTTPGEGWCNSPQVDGSHTLAVAAGAWSGSTAVQPALRLLTPDGATRALSLEQPAAQPWGYALRPRHTGFWLTVLQSTYGTGPCAFIRHLTPQGETAQNLRREDRQGPLLPNPLGGYIEVGGRLVDTTSIFEARWVDEARKPLTEWHTILTTQPPQTNTDFAFEVDRKGRLLMLARFYPPSFGAPLPPSTWRFAARWVGMEGPLGPEFEPAIPKTLSGDGTWTFQDFGVLMPLTDGGIAAYRHPAWSADVTLSPPEGWYATYPSGEAQAKGAPAWMKGHDHSLQSLHSGRGYVAVRRAPKTCARTVELMAPSGRACFALRMEGSEGCEAGDKLWPDGTLVVEAPSPTCHLRWWPGLAQLVR